jgi:non-ribosomal peptide synthetase-like protein
MWQAGSLSTGSWSAEIGVAGNGRWGVSTAGGLDSALKPTDPAAAVPQPGAPDGVEAGLAAVLREVLDVADTPAEANFFTDLGADSMLMAQFCARVRKRGDLPRVSMKDIYASPTLRELAAALPAPAPAAAPRSVGSPTTPDLAQAAPTEQAPPAVLAGHAADGAAAGVPAPGHPAVAEPAAAPTTAPTTAPATALTAEPLPRRARGGLAMRLCGIVQLIALLAPVFAGGLVGVGGFDIIGPANGPVANYLRAVEFSGLLVAAALVLPVAAKWLLIGRFKVEEIPVWSFRYLRFWTVKLLLTRNPMLRLMVGSPIYPVYLRALGARVGRGTTILTRYIPICPDLLTIGARTIVRRDALLFGYHAQAGAVRTGRVTLGDEVVVGTRAVLDIDTTIGNHGQLGHASALHPGQRIPAGEHWCGSPAAVTTVDFTEVPAVSSSRFRRGRFAAWQLLNAALITTPLGLGLGVGLSAAATHLCGFDNWGDSSMTSAVFYGRALGAAAVILAGLLLLGIPLLLLAVRVLGLLVRPGRVYRMDGFHYAVLRTLYRASNYKFPTQLTGDSSLIVHYLTALGWRLKPCRQTGTNFGLTVNQESPFAVSVGTGTVIADGLLVSNTEYSRSSFRVIPTRIGAENFLGNMITYPTRSRIGDNCLLATKVMVPIDGEQRDGVGLLGSPSFVIPRTVNRDHGLAVTDPAALARSLAAKTRHNAVTIALFLAVRWLYLFLLIVWAEGAGETYRSYGVLAMSATTVGFALATLSYFVLVERSVDFLCALVPNGVSIYDRAFWRHERFWKVPSHNYPMLFNGTPWKPLIWRALGVRIGRRVFDDGGMFIEKRFATVGDDATLNMLTIVQCHSQEDGAFKSNRITIGPGVTLGVGAFVHYGVTMGQNSELAADSFLMKGEEVPADARWAGNPARETAAGGAMTTMPVGDIR